MLQAHEREFRQVIRNPCKRLSAVLALAALAVGGQTLSARGGEDAPVDAQRVATVRFEQTELTLRGRDARCQLLLSQGASDGPVADRTRDAQYVCDPPGVVTIDAQGLVTPLAAGTAAVVARLEGADVATAVVHVELPPGDQPVNFPNQIVPLFTKYGCNGGGCHGKLAGQNGFRLSLLGSEPREDYDHLVHESRGRRLSPAAPDASLLLQKAIASLPHGGGQRLAADTHEYRLLRRWIAQAMPYGSDADPRVTGIQVVPSARQTVPQAEQQLCVVATYSDGSTEDITRTAQYESNNLDMADVNVDGLVQVGDLAGEVSIMVRYQGHVAVFRASIPLGELTAPLPIARGPIDEAVFRKLATLGIPPSEVCDDSVFLRRVTLDLAGRLPTLAEIEQFRQAGELAQGSDPLAARQQRRVALVDRLLASADYAAVFANKWSAILRNKHAGEDTRYGAYAFHDWIRQSVFENKPIDQFVRELLTASGDVEANPAVVWYRQVDTTESRIEDAAQLFLGQRLQCARCHHHPYEKWAQQDYFQMAAFFTTVERREGGAPAEPRFVPRVGAAAAAHPKTGQAVSPAGLDAPPANVAAYEDPRRAFAAWMTSPDNPYFASSIANRYWKHFLGRGLVEPEDDMRVTNPPTNPELLDVLAGLLVESGFDVKHLVREICTSTTYQLAATPNELNLRDTTCYSRFYPKRLTAETLLDAIDQVVDGKTEFEGMPLGTRAVELPDTSFASYFLTVFGRPDSATACECERATEANLAQSLHLLNSQEMQGKLAAETGRPAAWAILGPPEASLSQAEQVRATAPDRIRELYLRSYGREPTASELHVALDYVMLRSDRLREAFEDLTWSVINSKEFLFNH